MEILRKILEKFDKKELLSEEIKFTKDIQIKNFSSVKHCKETRVYFVVKCVSYPLIFCVSLYPNGVSLQTEGFLSVQFFKFFIDTRKLIYVHDVLWMLSIVDVNGNGHYCQSFANENITGYPYNLIVSEFMKRSIIEDNADLLLPDNVLTLRCELLYICKNELRNSYLKHYTRERSRWYFLYHKIYAKEVFKPPLLPIQNFDEFHDSALNQAMQFHLNYEYPGVDYHIVTFCRSMDTVVEMFLKNFITYVSYMNLNDLECQLDKYSKLVVMDEFCDAYITCNCIFRTYIFCKQIYREAFNKLLLDKNLLKPGYVFFFKWLNIPMMRMKEKSLHFSDIPLIPLNDRIENHTKLSIMEERHFIEEVIDTCKVQSVSCCNTWSCVRDAFVYLLIDEDMLTASENVLKYPVRDYRITAVDMACQINFLQFLHDGNIETKSVTTLCKLYEMAEVYDVESLRYLCADRIKGFLTKDNIDSVKKIRHQRDFYLEGLINSFERESAQNEGWFVN